MGFMNPSASTRKNDWAFCSPEFLGNRTDLSDLNPHISSVLQDIRWLDFHKGKTSPRKDERCYWWVWVNAGKFYLSCQIIHKEAASASLKLCQHHTIILELTNSHQRTDIFVCWTIRSIQLLNQSCPTWRTICISLGTGWELRAMVSPHSLLFPQSRQQADNSTIVYECGVWEQTMYLSVTSL